MDLERRLDATWVRKRLESQSASSKPPTIKRTLRVYLSNLAHDQRSVKIDEEKDEGKDVTMEEREERNAKPTEEGPSVTDGLKENETPKPMEETKGSNGIMATEEVKSAETSVTGSSSATSQLEGSKALPKEGEVHGMNEGPSNPPSEETATTTDKAEVKPKEEPHAFTTQPLTPNPGSGTPGETAALSTLGEDVTMKEASLPATSQTTASTSTPNPSSDSASQKPGEGAGAGGSGKKDQDQMDKHPSWTLRVEGRLLNIPHYHPKVKPSHKHFSSLLQSMVIELRPASASTGENPSSASSSSSSSSTSKVTEPTETIEWKNGPEVVPTDGFEIKRRGETEMTARIILRPIQAIDRYRVERGLARVIDLREGTRTDVILALWTYIKHHRLSNRSDRRKIRCDGQLQSVFGVEEFLFTDVPALISPRLLPLSPSILEYTIKLDKEYTKSPVAWDIELEMVDERKFDPSQMASMQKEVMALEDRITTCVQSIRNSQSKRAFLSNFSEDPSGWINRWVASQAADLETALGEHHGNVEQKRRSDYWKAEWVDEAVTHYLHSKEL